VKEGLGKRLSELTKSKLDTRADKVKKVFKYITNPDYELKTSSFRFEIEKLMKENNLFKSDPQEMNKLWNEITKEYQYKDAKGNIKNSLDDLGYKIRWLEPGSDRSVGYLLEIAESHKLGKSRFSDWEKIAGKKPEQWAMQQVQHAWEKNDPRMKFYDKNGKPITWEAGKKLKSSEILFSYTDENLRGFDNKLYSFNKPGKDAPIWKNTTKQIIGLEDSIRNLDEFKELVEVVDGRNKLNSTKMFNPFRNKETIYKTYFEDIYKQVGVTTKKGHYTKAKALSAHIDHKFGKGKNLFNNLRLSTGQQNQMFKILENAALKNPELRPYVQALEAEIYGGGSIDNQIKNIVKQTDDIGKLVASSPGKVTLPTAMDTASYKFLKNEIPGMPESVIRYLTPFAEKAEGIYKQNPDLLKIFKDSGIPCPLGAGGNCTTPEDFRKGFNQLVKEAADGKGSKQAISKLTNFTKGMRKLKGAATWTGYGLLAEAGFMVPFAIGDYAAGKKWSRILGNATDYGFGPIFGESEQEEFEAALPKGSAAPQRRNIMELGERLDMMEQQKVNPGYGRVGFEKKAPEQRQKVYDDTFDEYMLNMQPFIRPTPHTEQGQFYDQGLMDKAKQEDIDTMNKIRQEDLIRKQQRDIEMPMDFMAAGGGIASLKKKW